MQTAYYICRDCKAEFEMIIDENPMCLMCDSENVKEQKNSSLNCNICCDNCDIKEECDDWKMKNL